MEFFHSFTPEPLLLYARVLLSCAVELRPFNRSFHFAGAQLRWYGWSMDRNDLGFGQRLGMAFRLVFNVEFARQVQAGLKVIETKEAQPAAAPKPLAPPPEKVHASGLLLLAALQREGRFVDFLRQEVAGFSDEEVGAAARVVHSGCGKILNQYFDLEPASPGSEGTSIAVPQAFDAQKIRLTGNVTGQAPYKGTLKHHGWIAKSIRMPEISESMDPRVIAPAEVELA
jgi:hypothetical protein